MLLALAALARDRAVVVSRGELVEIGGGFRVPEVMAQSGARLVEVGTTNRTRLADYQAAVDGELTTWPSCLKVHQSNYRIVGFTESVDVAGLVGAGAAGRRRHRVGAARRGHARGSRAARRRGWRASRRPARRWPPAPRR